MDQTVSVPQPTTYRDTNPYALTREQLIRTQIFSTMLERVGTDRCTDSAFTEALLRQANVIAQWVIDGSRGTN